MPFCVFGSSSENVYIDHILSRAPNVQLSASGVKLDLDGPVDLSRPLVAILDQQHESLQQPFTVRHPPAFFVPGASLDVSIYDHYDATKPLTEKPIATGKLILPINRSRLFVDFAHLNEEAAADIYVVAPPSNVAAEAVKEDLVVVADRVVELFQKGEIVWMDNVVNTIIKLCPSAKRYEVTLGVPEGGLIDREYVVLSRFLGRVRAENAAVTMLKRFSAEMAK